MDPNIIIKSPIIRPEDMTMEKLRHLSADSFPLWCLANKIKVDSNTLEFNTHRYLLPIYADNTDYKVWQKAAQVGATIHMLLELLYFLEKNQGRKAAIYFPTRDGADNLSQDRLEPIIRATPSIAAIYREGSKMSLRKIGDSSLYIFHLGGSASKDSMPLDMLAFDEVRLVSLKDIDQARERISHSSHKKQLMASTCGRPGDTINKLFMGGNQLTWLPRCGCTDGCDLARQWPDCVVENPSTKELYLRCTKCGYKIKDTQNGRYVPMNPGGDYNSYHMCQLHSKYISLREIWRSYKTTSNMTEFYNAKLGLPYVDIDNRGVSKETLMSLVDNTLPWGVDDPTQKSRRTAMGVDVGADYVYVTILDISPDGNKKRLRHIEVVERRNRDYFDHNGEQQSPFVRVRQLIKEFNVGMCVIDQAPNYSEVMELSKEFPGKVFAANYTTGGQNVVEWGDRSTTAEGVRKSGKYRNKYFVNIHRFHGFQAMFSEFNAGDFVLPNYYGLRQMMRSETTGLFEPTAVMDRFMDMLPRLYKTFRVHDELTGAGTWVWEYSGNDPHCSHSTLYANVALERLRKQVIYTFA
jgi:hypothetical protein